MAVVSFSRSAVLTALVLVVATVVASSPVLAHQDVVEQHATASIAGAGPEAAGVAVATLVLAALLAAGARCRRVFTLAFALVLLVLPYETGLHSVHHLDSAQDVSQCAVAGVTSQLSAAVGEPAVTLSGLGCVAILSPAVDVARVAPPAWPAWCGRAPPLLIAS